MPNEQFPAVFLDRDGTLMRDVEYCGDPKQVEIFDGVWQALRRLKNAGFKLIVITNQSGIGRGYFTEEDYRAVEAEVQRQLPMIDATYFCPHQPNDDCACRKPKPQMIFDAQSEHHLDLGRSFFIGDKPLDAECGRNAGVRTILVETGVDQPNESSVANLPKATEMILGDAH
ncbi:MAG: HAD family hydrolase [Verrucomicrobiota bacterium]|nr:HAD family hydrolase [Verrucomicrobiota bacterium]